MDTVIAISGHRKGKDAVGVPDHFEVGAIASGLGTIEINKGNRRVVGVGVVVKNGVRGSNCTAASSPAGIVGVKLGVVCSDGCDSHASQRDTSCSVSVAACYLGLGDAGQSGVGSVEGGCRAEHHLKGVTFGVGSAGKSSCCVVVNRYGDGHYKAKLSPRLPVTDLETQQLVG